MLLYNIFLVIAFTINVPIIQIIRHNKLVMCDKTFDNNDFNNFNFNNNDFNINNIALSSASKTSKLIRTWFYELEQSEYEYPEFIYRNLANVLQYAINNTNTDYIYIIYISKQELEPSFIGCFKINSQERNFYIEEICCNPFLETVNITLFKNELLSLTHITGVTLNISHLSHLTDKRFYLDFIYF